MKSANHQDTEITKKIKCFSWCNLVFSVSWWFVF